MIRRLTTSHRRRMGKRGQTRTWNFSVSVVIIRTTAKHKSINLNSISSISETFSRKITRENYFNCSQKSNSFSPKNQFSKAARKGCKTQIINIDNFCDFEMVFRICLFLNRKIKYSHTIVEQENFVYTIF